MVLSRLRVAVAVRVILGIPMKSVMQSRYYLRFLFVPRNFADRQLGRYSARRVHCRVQTSLANHERETHTAAIEHLLMFD